MQIMTNFFHELKLSKALIIAISASSLTLPGIGFVSTFIPTMLQLETLKLLLICSSFSLPFQLFSFCIFCLYFMEHSPNKSEITDESAWAAAASCSITSTLLISIVCLLKAFIPAYEPRWAILTVLVILLFLLIDSILDYRGMRRLANDEIEKDKNVVH